LPLPHLSDQFAARFAGDPNIEFVSLDLVLRETRFGANAGEPDATFNIYMVRAQTLKWKFFD